MVLQDLIHSDYGENFSDKNSVFGLTRTPSLNSIIEENNEDCSMNVDDIECNDAMSCNIPKHSAVSVSFLF